VGVRVGGQEISADAVIVAVGVEPEVELARRLGAQLGPTGAIAIDERLATSVPHVWAAGDCAELRDVVTGHPVYRPLGSLANRQGRTLGSILAGRTDTFPPVAGAVAVKVFDFNVAAVGCTSEWAARHGLTARSVWITAEDRASYWPEVQSIHLKLVYEPGSTRVLGLQVAGKGDAIKRVDTATQLIGEGATLARFAQLEHAYAPPYAPAVDPLAVAAWAALNQEEGVKAEGPLEQLDEVLDVRLQEERERRPAPARHVIEAGLRTIRSGEDVPALDGGLVVCERGTRSAEAVRYLRGGDGERTRYLGGGLMWRYAAGKGNS
jgi:rhodanese-related sulfurtransferase